MNFYCACILEASREKSNTTFNSLHQQVKAYNKVIDFGALKKLLFVLGLSLLWVLFWFCNIDFKRRVSRTNLPMKKEPMNPQKLSQACLLKTQLLMKEKHLLPIN